MRLGWTATSGTRLLELVFPVETRYRLSRKPICTQAGRASEPSQHFTRSSLRVSNAPIWRGVESVGAACACVPTANLAWDNLCCCCCPACAVAGELTTRGSVWTGCGRRRACRSAGAGREGRRRASGPSERTEQENGRVGGTDKLSR